MLLLSLNTANAAVGRTVLAQLKRDIDPAAAPLWIDAHGVGVFLSSANPAWKVWKMLFDSTTLTRDQLMDIKDHLLIQVGPDYFADAAHKAAAWMNSRFPKP